MRKFFVLGMGRSGTKFLAHLFNRDQKAYVQHEPYDLDKQLIFYRYAGNFNTVIDQLLEERFERIFSQVGKDIKVYGEVNSYLRYEVDWLRKKGWNCYFIVRDGREFVRSAYPRKTYTPYDLQQSIIPKDSTFYASQWDEMDRFEKLCWYWDHTNRYLLPKFSQNEIIKFENIISAYEQLREKILEPENLEIPISLWRKEINKPKNATRKKSFKSRLKRLLLKKQQRNVKTISSYPHWETSKIEKFNEICGETMKRLDY